MMFMWSITGLDVAKEVNFSNDVNIHLSSLP